MQLKPGDWVFCVRQPMPRIYLTLVRLVHLRGAKLAASWMFAPEFLPPKPPHGERFVKAITETDAVISVSHCTAHQFEEVYGYTGEVHVVPYHNRPFFEQVVPLPPGPPWRIGYIGRLDIKQKNLDNLLKALAEVVEIDHQVELHLYGRGPDREALKKLTQELDIHEKVVFHGPYDHRRDLPGIMANCHFFVYPSRYEGGPCFSLLELLQAGRFCVAARVGGIPDLYDGHPEAGILVHPDHIAELSQGLLAALDKVINGTMDVKRIRARYFDGFDIMSAHKAWMLVLDHALVNGQS